MRVFAITWTLVSGASSGDGCADPSGSTCSACSLLASISRGSFAPPTHRTITVKRNGANDGAARFSAPSAAYALDCASALAVLAAAALRVETRGALRLMTDMGDPWTALEGAAAAGEDDVTLHLLLPAETWVWPGVAVGHTWSVEGAQLTTLSLAPRVIFVENILTAQECADLIANGVNNLYRSPEKHYSTDDKFKNYRTSHTAMLGRGSGAGRAVARKARARVARIARFPTTEHCEALQLVRYTNGTWYKQHQDYFHGWRARAGAVAVDAAKDPHAALRTSSDAGRAFLVWLQRATALVRSANAAGAAEGGDAAAAELAARGALRRRVADRAAKMRAANPERGDPLSDALQLELVHTLILAPTDWRTDEGASGEQALDLSDGWREWLAENYAVRCVGGARRRLRRSAPPPSHAIGSSSLALPPPTTPPTTEPTDCTQAGRLERAARLLYGSARRRGAEQRRRDGPGRGRAAPRACVVERPRRRRDGGDRGGGGAK